MSFFVWRTWLDKMARTLQHRWGGKRKRRQEYGPRLMLEHLEDRLAPAVTAMQVGTTLDVNLGAGGDTASLTGTDPSGSIIQVAGTGYTTSTFNGVTDIDVTGTGSGDGQSVDFTSTGTNAINVTGAISVTDVADVLPSKARHHTALLLASLRCGCVHVDVLISV